MSERAASSGRTPDQASAARFPRQGPRFAPGWRAAVAEDAARVLFGPRDSRLNAATQLPPAPSLAELRDRVALQAGQLERAMAEIERLCTELRRAHARSEAAEQAVARERALRGRQAADAARRLHQQQQTIDELSADIRDQREAYAVPRTVGTGLLERRLAARARLDSHVAGVIAGARVAIVEVRDELARGRRRTATLEDELRRERRRSAALADRLGALESEPVAASGAGRARSPVAAEPAPRAWADVASACRKLELELAARDALEVQAAQLIGRLHRRLGTTG